ncbi:hypothetical protein AL542_15700 [Grimontia hollisae]|uniref:Uncharacterized protein n=1 Tax=Grimontia hollisae CIP 101886 TaxID=675812 RepID=D0I699_GRIHO|nr:hypothetical protein [Grimontia hollisae]AMG31633.1 hypothetical protein AL542_15700 [Grimontia hollisae]EEY72168.1 hypothetical protein VHA_001266 [Grimontia hollisae CIP 101886]STO45190.1 Uncharacterised protein [Grimontia hollisae]
MSSGVNALAGRALTNVINKDSDLKTTEVGKNFEELVNVADLAVETFLEQKGTQDGLQLSAAESLELQRLMGDQSITVQTGTSTLKSIKDSITSAARNI